MTIRTTVILIILTLIFAVVFFYFLNQNSKIAELAVTQDPVYISKTQKVFTDKDKDIYLFIKLNKVKKGENLKISWFKNTEDAGKTLIQESNVITQEKGSGFVKISLLNKNDRYENGSYELFVSLNKNTERSLEFRIE
ncbi:MAG: hypothetical protein ACYCXK_12145 [Candidatus Humimicrobiaceae bacterium]